MAAGRYGRDMPPRAAGRPGAVRRPRFAAFMGTGILVGVVAAVVLVLLAPENETFTRTQSAMYLALVLGMVGAVAGGAVAVMFDRRADRDERGGPADNAGDRGRVGRAPDRQPPRDAGEGHAGGR